jgi:hypothetical protein
MAEGEDGSRAASEGTHVQSVRLRQHLRVRIDNLVSVFRARPPGFPISRSEVLTKIIEAGLAVLEREHLPPGAPPAPSGDDATVRAEAPLARTHGSRSERVDESKLKSA